VPFIEQLLLESPVVLHDAVVDNDDLAFAVRVGMGVGLGHAAMCRPARVADANVAVDGLLGKQICEVLYSAHAPASDQLAVLDDRQTGRVVATILKPTQALEND